MTVLFPISHEFRFNIYYVLTELGYVLSVILRKKENVVLKILL